MVFLFFALACVPDTASPVETGWVANWDSGSGTVEDPGQTDTERSFAGSIPLEPLGLPEFSVSNQYGLMRSADYLEGSPVALWFFTTGWTDC
jgi:hypothetical protein